VTGSERPDRRTLEAQVLARVLRLDAAATGLVCGLAAGLLLFVATVWLLVKGGEVVGPHLGLLGHLLPGYRVSLGGSLVGLGWGLALGFVVGYAVAFLYNRLVAWRHREP
jgi:hypothetical protein